MVCGDGMKEVLIRYARIKMLRCIVCMRVMIYENRKAGGMRESANVMISRLANGGE